ncbi:MAG: hypothetical protein ACRDHZ_19345, partial [Ktedonobacteraceae bacterium]
MQKYLYNTLILKIMSMQITNIAWSNYRIPFRHPFITAHGTLTERVGALVTVHTDAGYIGNGETAPLPEHSGVSLTAALNALSGLAHELRGRDVQEVLRFLAEPGQEAQLPAALLYGLETALLDVCGQVSGQSLAELLTCDNWCEQERRPLVAPRTRIPV